MLVNLNHRLEDKQLHVTLTPAAKELIIDQGFDPVYGARPLKRYLQSQWKPWWHAGSSLPTCPWHDHAGGCQGWSAGGRVINTEGLRPLRPIPGNFDRLSALR